MYYSLNLFINYIKIPKKKLKYINIIFNNIYILLKNLNY